MINRSSSRQIKPAHSLLAAASAAVLTLPLSGCLVAGWSSQGGGFIWPGGALGVIVLLALLYFLLRGR